MSFSTDADELGCCNMYDSGAPSGRDRRQGLCHSWLLKAIGSAAGAVAIMSNSSGFGTSGVHVAIGSMPSAAELAGEGTVGRCPNEVGSGTPINCRFRHLQLRQPRNWPQK
jgi:hypothetical protein